MSGLSKTLSDYPLAGIALETENDRYCYQAVNKQDWRSTGCV